MASKVITDSRFNYLKFIDYTDVLLWDVKRYTGDFLEFQEGYTLLSDILTVHKKELPHSKIKRDKLRIISKINFGGQLFLREFEEIETYKGKLYEVLPNTIIYSKINARHGCIYYHSKDNQIFGVSSEYPCFKIDETKVLGQYLHLVLRSLKVKTHLKASVTGISKARLKIDEFLSLPIPLPPIEKQKEIVDNLHSIKVNSKSQSKEASNLKNGVRLFWQSKTNIPLFVERPISYGFHLTELKDIKRWGTEFILGGQESYEPKHEERRIDEICKIGSGGTPSRKRLDYYEDGNILWVKTTEVRNKIITDTEEKITEEALKNSSAKLYPAGSLLIAMYGQGLTRGRTAKLAVPASTNQACAVLHEIDNEVILTDYLWYYLQNEYFRLRQLASGNNQPNLNADMIKSYKIQIPPIEKQKEIIEHIAEIRKETKRLNKEAEESQRLAIEEFEKELFQEAE